MQSVVNKVGFKSTELKCVSGLSAQGDTDPSKKGKSPLMQGGACAAPPSIKAALHSTVRRWRFCGSAYQPALSLRASSPPLCGAAPFPRSASAAPSRAASSARVLAAAAVRGQKPQDLDVFHVKSHLCGNRRNPHESMKH